MNVKEITPCQNLGKATEANFREKCIAVNTIFKRRGIPDSPVIRTPCSHCREHGFDPWSGI